MSCNTNRAKCVNRETINFFSASQHKTVANPIGREDAGITAAQTFVVNICVGR